MSRYATMKQALVMHPLPSIPLLYGRWTKCIVISPHFLLSLYHSPNWHYIQNHQHISFSQKLHSIAVIPLPDLSLPPGSPDEAERTCGRRRRIGRWRVGGRRIRGRWIGWRWIRGRWIRRRWVSGNRHRIGRNRHRIRRNWRREGRRRVGRYGRRNGGSTDRRDARSRYLQHAIPILCIFVDQGLLEEGGVLGGVMLQALVLPSEEVTDPCLFGIGNLRRRDDQQADQSDGRPR